MLVDFNEIREILITCKTIAVVGLSPKSTRPSHRVAGYLLEAGYRVIPVNPGQSEILGQACYPNLSAIPVAVDLVNIFRRSQDVPPVVDAAIKIKAKAVWMQEGIINNEAAAKARRHGLRVVMDRCTMTDHADLL